MINFKCYEVIWSVEENRLKRVRFSVFIEEQGVAQEEEWDEEDINSRHFLAVDDADRPIGTARLTPDGQIGRMAVVKELRGNGIGKTLLKLAINGAKNAGFTTVFLHAQEHAIDFYKQEQFVEEGKLFMEAGISHRLMTKQLL